VPELSLSQQTLEWIAVIAAGVAGLALLLAFLAHLRFARMRREYATLQGDDDSGSLISAVRRQMDDVERLRGEIAAAERQVASARADLADAIRHVAVVRYDAFADMGGRLSFSAAMLDDAGDGLVLTSINGRSETRTYAKGVKAGASEHSLSPEEDQAIGFALRRASGAPTRRARPAAVDVSKPGVAAASDDSEDIEGVTIHHR
jgi:hypothetical protein